MSASGQPKEALIKLRDAPAHPHGSFLVRCFLKPTLIGMA